jgi:hypothetical protein
MYDEVSREETLHVIPTNQLSTGLIIDKVDVGSLTANEFVANACDKVRP